MINLLTHLVRLVLLIAAVAYVGLMVLALGADKLIFQPHPSSYRPAQLAALGSNGIYPVTFSSGQASISAVYLRNPAARYTLLYSHGNGEDIGDVLPNLEEFRRAGFAVFAYDYRGYGTSTGKPSEEGVYQDVDSAYSFLTGTQHVEPQHIIAFGHSLGCAAAIHLAANHAVAGLVVEAPFLSAFRVLTQVRLLPWDKFNNASQIAKVRCPVLVIHGRRDGVIAWWQGERLFQLAHEPKQHLWVDGAGHNDLMVVAPRLIVATLRSFSESIVPGVGTSAAR